MIFSPISVTSLPKKYERRSFSGARALPSLSGNGVYLQKQQYLYEHVCSTSSCNWTIMEKQLKNPVSYATLMYLPHDYCVKPPFHKKADCCYDPTTTTTTTTTTSTTIKGRNDKVVHWQPKISIPLLFK